MRKRFIAFLGLKGSWRWACKKMDQGYVVRQSTDTGQAKYRLDFEGQRRILCTFKRQPTKNIHWDNAYIFLSDFECTEWVIA